MKITKLIRLTVGEKRAKGTHQKSRDPNRPLPEIRAEIQDALDCLDMMRGNLTMAAHGIKTKGMYLLTRATNNKGVVVTTKSSTRPSKSSVKPWAH